MDIDPNDNGYSSRKLALACLSMALICAGGAMAAEWPAFAASYPTMVGGILAAACIYTGGNVAVKHIATKASSAQKSDAKADDDSADAG